MLTAADRAYTRATQAVTFIDTCERLIYAAGSGDYGYGDATYVAGEIMPCLFIEGPVREAMSEAQVEMADAELHLAYGTQLESEDRIRITHIWGSALAEPRTYEITKGPMLKHTLLYAELGLVTGEGA